MESSVLARASLGYLGRASVGSPEGSSGRAMNNAKGASEPNKGFGTGVDPEYEARLIAVAQEMMEKVEVKDRSYHFKTHKNCFVGKEAVKFLVWSGRAANIAEALALGNALMQRGVFSHATNDHSFKNEALYYRFNSGSLPQKGLASAVRASGGYSSSSLESGLHPQASGTVDSLMQYSLETPEELESRVAAVAAQLRDSLPVKDRFWHMKMHKSCFSGREAVKWLVENGHAGSDSEAIAIGKALLQRGTMLSVAGADIAFKNDDTLYRFRVHDEAFQRGMAWLGSAGLKAEMKGVVRDLMARVDVRDRAGRLVPHRSSFFGKDAASCLIAAGHAKSSEDAVALGNALMNQQVFSSVTGRYPFRNEELLYRFAAHEEDALPSEGMASRTPSSESLRRLGWGANSGERVSDEDFEAKLQTVVKTLMSGVDIKDRSWHLKAYKKCFVGREAVKFLMEQRFANSIDVALMIGDALLKRGIVAHVNGENSFKNDDTFYRFKAHDEFVRKGMHWLSKSRGLDGNLEKAARAMLAKLPIKDRSRKLKRHRKCFVGKEAVQFLIQQGLADSTDAALQLGNALMDKGVFSHVTGSHAFKNESYLFYRFKAHEEEEDKGAAGAMKRQVRGQEPRGRAMSAFTQEQKAHDHSRHGGCNHATSAGEWKTIMQGLDELAISAVGVDSVRKAIEVVGQESIAAGLLHWGITHVVLALSYLDDFSKNGGPAEVAIPQADELLGKAGQRCNEALHYKPDLHRAAMMISVIHHLRAVMHSGLLDVRETMAYFNACLASGGVLALDSGEGAAVVSLSTVLEDGEDDPLNQFLASQAANLGATQPTMQAERVIAADVHFQSSIRVMEALIRTLPAKHRAPRSRQKDTGSASEEDEEEGFAAGRSAFETVCDMWGLLLWEKSQIWAAVGRPWKPLLDQAVDKLREGGAREADIDLLIACHIMMQQAQ